MTAFCATFILLASAATAGITPIPCETFTLDNGIRCVVSEKHDAPLVAMHVYVDAGLIHEGEFAGSGISHFIEHLAAEALNPLGTTANAYTTVDHVCYHCAVLREKWEDALGLVAACVTNGAFPLALQDREKGVIAQEIRMDAEEPDTAHGRLLDEMLYTRGPLRAPLAGWLDSFTNISPDNVAAYHQRQYLGNNMIVAVAGDVTVAEARQAITKAFASVPRGPAVAPALPIEPRPLGPRVGVRRFNVKVARVALAFPGVQMGSTDMYALDLLAAVLGDGDTSILVKRLKDDLQLVYRISAGSWTPYFCPGTFTVSFECDETNVAAAIHHTLAALESTRRAPVDQRRLDRVRRTMLVGRLRGLQDADAVAGSLGDGIMLCGDPNYTAHYLQGLVGVTTSDIQRAAHAYLDTNIMTTALLLPAHGQETTGVATASVVAACTASVERLANGVRVVLMPKADAGLVALSAWLPGGLAYESPDNNGISAFTAALMTKGTLQLDADAFAAAVESLGASLDVIAGREGIEAAAECLPGDVDAVARLMAGAVLDPVFAPAEVEKQRRLQLGAISTRCDDWYPEAMLHFNRTFFGGHPYAMPQTGESNVVVRLSRNDLAAFHRCMIQPSNMVVTIAGAFDPAAMRALMAALFGGAVATALPLPVCVTHTPPSTNSVRTVPVPRAQATVMIGYGSPAGLDARRHAASIACGSLRGFEGALFRALRGDTNLVYIATAMPVVDAHAGAMVCLAQCEPGAVPCVIAKMTNVVADLARTTLADTRLARVKSDIVTALCDQRQMLRSLASTAGLYEYRGLGANTFLHLPDDIRAVTAAQTHDVAASNYIAWTCVVVVPEGR